MKETILFGNVFLAAFTVAAAVHVAPGKKAEAASAANTTHKTIIADGAETLIRGMADAMSTRPGKVKAVLLKKSAPELEPKLRDVSSDKKFMAEDYPDDEQAGAKTGRVSENLPYPAVQSAASFDKDYVADENNNKMDKATWDAQLKYAREVKAAQADFDRTQDKLEKEKKDVLDAKARLEVMKKQLADALAAEKKAAAEHDKANQYIGEKRHAAVKSATSVEEGTQIVEKEVGDLQKCEEELKAAKEKLERLQQHAMAAAKQDAQAEMLVQKTKDLALDAEEKESALEKQLAEETAEYAKSVEQHAKEVADVNALTDDLERAETRLRKYRSPGSPVQFSGNGADKGARSGACCAVGTAAPAVVATMTAISMSFF